MSKYYQIFYPLLLLFSLIRINTVECVLNHHYIENIFMDSNVMANRTTVDHVNSLRAQCPTR